MVRVQYVETSMPISSINTIFMNPWKFGQKQSTSHKYIHQITIHQVLAIHTEENCVQMMRLHGWDSTFMITTVSSTKGIGPTHTSPYILQKEKLQKYFFFRKSSPLVFIFQNFHGFLLRHSGFSSAKRISKRGSVLKVRGGCYNYIFKH